MEAEKSYDPPLASRRTKKASGVRPSPKARESGVSLRATGSRSASVRRPGHEPMDGSGQAERVDPPCPRLPASPKPLADCTTPACPGEGGLRSAYQPKRQSLPETPSRTRSEVTRGLPAGRPLAPSSRRGGSDRHASAASTSVPIAAPRFPNCSGLPEALPALSLDQQRRLWAAGSGCQPRRLRGVMPLEDGGVTSVSVYWQRDVPDNLGRSSHSW